MDDLKSGVVEIIEYMALLRNLGDIRNVIQLVAYVESALGDIILA